MITVKNIEKISSGYPTQWKGTTECDRQIYVRYRCGHLTVMIGPPGDMPSDSSVSAAMRGEEIVSENIGKPHEGIITYGVMRQHTEAHGIAWPDSDR